MSHGLLVDTVKSDIDLLINHIVFLLYNNGLSCKQYVRNGFMVFRIEDTCDVTIDGAPSNASFVGHVLINSINNVLVSIGGLSDKVTTSLGASDPEFSIKILRQFGACQFDIDLLSSENLI